MFPTTESSRDDVKAVKIEWEKFVDVDVAHFLDELKDRAHPRAAYWPLYRPGFIPEFDSPFGIKNRERLDMAIRAVCQHLATSFTDSDLDESNRVRFHRNLMLGWRLMRTGQWYYGVVPATAKPGDKVCRFKGSDTTYVVRESGSDH